MATTLAPTCANINIDSENGSVISDDASGLFDLSNTSTNSSGVSSPCTSVVGDELNSRKDSNSERTSSPGSGFSEIGISSPVKQHAKLEEFAASLQEAASRIFPNNGRARSRYKSVKVLLLSWEESDLYVECEVKALESVFSIAYRFDTEIWKIPSKASHRRLTSRVLDFADDFGAADCLLIVHYSGHGSLTDSRQSQWLCTSKPYSASVNWSATQPLLEESESDVLILLDCCHAASSTSATGRGVTEIIAACGFEGRAPPPGPRSFTTCITTILQDWADKSYSAAMLHSESLFRLRHERPEHTRNQTGLREVRSSPIHTISSADPRVPSISLSKIDPPQPTESKMKSWPHGKHTFSETEVVCGGIPSQPNTGKQHHNWSSEGPLAQVFLTIQMDATQPLDPAVWKCWFSEIPVIVQELKVNSGFADFGMLEGKQLPWYETGSRDVPVAATLQEPTCTRPCCKLLPLKKKTSAHVILPTDFHNNIASKYPATDLSFPKARSHVGSQPIQAQHVSRGVEHRDPSNRTQIQNPRDEIALTTTTPPLLGSTRCSADEMEGGASQTSEEDYQWDISEATDSIDECDLDSTSEFSHPDASNFARILASSSACLKRDIVELLMRKYYQIFGRDGSGHLRTRPASQQESHSNGSTNSGSRNNPVISDSRDKRKAEDSDENGGENNGSKPARKRKRDNTRLLEPSKCPRRYACPYHKHDPQKFRRASSRAFTACDNEGFDTIGHLKEHLSRAHYERNKCPRCKFVCRAADFRSHIQQQPSCEPRAEGQGDARIGFSHCFAVWLKEKKKSATEADSIERWREIYKELFPNEIIPSPFVFSEDESTSVGIHSRQDANQLEDQHTLQYRAVQALFQGQVDTVVDTAVNNLEPTVHGLLELVPNTNLDEVDLGFLNWPESVLSDTFQPNYPSAARPHFAQVGDSGNHRHERSSAANQTQKASQCPGLGTHQNSQPVSGPWRNGPVSPSFDSAYGEGVGVTSSNLLEEPAGSQAAYQPLNISYLNSQIQTQVQAEVAPLIQSIAALNAMVRQAFSPGTRILPHVSEPPNEGTTDGRILHGRSSANGKMDNNTRPSTGQPGRDPGLGSSGFHGEIGETSGQQNTDSRVDGIYGSQTANPSVQLHPLGEFSSMFDN